MGFRAEGEHVDAGNFLTPCPSWRPRKQKLSPLMAAHQQGPSEPLRCVFAHHQSSRPLWASILLMTTGCELLLTLLASPDSLSLRLDTGQHQAPAMPSTGCSIFASWYFLCLGWLSPSDFIQEDPPYTGLTLNIIFQAPSFMAPTWSPKLPSDSTFTTLC